MELVLIDKRVEARNTLALVFKKKNSFDFIPGDFIYLPVELKYDDSRGNIRQLSICTSPTEKNLEVVVRLRSE
ncbi:hypothetical protein KW795_01755 [Candidatus Microgenomates bacterium]|nr:hypothetical protein [Candidatus Microgenomates bacterium]